MHEWMSEWTTMIPFGSKIDQTLFYDFDQNLYQDNNWQWFHQLATTEKPTLNIRPIAKKFERGGAHPSSHMIHVYVYMYCMSESSGNFHF